MVNSVKTLYLRWRLRLVQRELRLSYDDLSYFKDMGDMLAVTETRVWIGLCEAELTRLSALQPSTFQLTTT